MSHASTQRRAGFIVSPRYDWAFFLAAPLWALALGYACAFLPGEKNAVAFLNAPTTLTAVALRTVIHSHLVLVFFRSHGNPDVFRRHPLRFVAAPLALFIAMLLSPWFLALIIVVTTFWDVYHSSMQTFGFGRIYDAKAGADPTRGRLLDMLLNHALYIVPLVAGPVFPALVGYFQAFHVVDEHRFDPFVVATLELLPSLQRPLLALGAVVVVVYTGVTLGKLRRGEPVSWQKLVLFSSTGIASFVAWMYNPFGQALLIVNVFHAVQYFAVVWWSEQRSMSLWMGLSHHLNATLISFLLLGTLYGFWIGATGTMWATHPMANVVVLALTNTVALLHFWYDGFVWSVRKRDVPV